MTKEQEQQLRTQAKQRGYDKAKTDAFIEFVNSKGGLPTPSPIPKPTSTQPKRNLLQKAAGFLGVEKFGQGVASALRTPEELNQTGRQEGQLMQDSQRLIQAARKLPLGSPERTRLLKLAQGLGNAPTQTEIDPGTGLSNREVLGSAASVALNVATPGAFKGGLGARVAKNAGLGAGYGLAGGLNDGKEGKDLLTSTTIGTGLGAAIPVFGKILSTTTQRAFPSIARTLEQTSLRLTPVQKQNLGKDLNEITNFLVEKKIVGTPEKRFASVSRLYEQTENRLQDWLTVQKTAAKKDFLVAKLEDLKNRYMSGNHPDERDLFAIERQIDGVIALLKTRYPNEVPLARLNNLKRSTYKNAYNKAGDKVLDTVEHDIGDVFRSTIEELTKGKRIGLQEIGKFNQEYGKLIKARKLLKIAETRSQIGLVGKLVSAGIGAGIGNAFGNIFGGAIGAAVGPKVGETVAGTATRSLIGSALNKASKTSTGKAGQLIKKTIKRGLLNSQ